MIDGLSADVRDAARALTRRPLFTLTIVLTLAIVIGAGTSLWSVVQAVLLRPMPYPDASRLVALRGEDRVNGIADSNLSPPDVADFSARASTLEGAAAYSVTPSILSGGTEPAPVRVGIVTGGFFELLRARPAAGRLFLPEENTPGRHRVALLSQALWRQRFGGDPSVVGRTVQLNGVDYSVVGILPAGFSGPQPQAFETPDLWRPVPLQQEGRGGHWMKGIARLKSGVTPEQAQAELGAIALALESEHPDSNTGRLVQVVPLRESIVARARPALAALLGAVLFLVLIACANVAGLLLARAHERRQEVAVRVALGAGRGRMMRMALTESLVLALLGGAMGVLLALWGTDLLVGLSRRAIPRAEEIRLDAGVLLFALLLSCAIGLLAGLGPAWRLARQGLGGALKEGASTVAAGGRRLREFLVVTQMALSLVLLIGAGLMAGSLERLLRVDPGFQTADLLTFNLSLPASRYPENAQATALFDRLLERISGLPGVQGTGAVNIAPLTGSSSCDGFTLPEHPPVPAGQEPCAEARTATAGYLQAMGIPVRRGRGFAVADVPGAPPVALVNEAFAARFFPGEDPIGRHISLGEDTGPRAIVGIIGNIHHFSLSEGSAPEYYVPAAQNPNSQMTVVLSAGADPSTLVTEVRAAVQSLDPGLAIDRISTGRDLLAGSASQPRFRAVLSGTLAIAALLLAAVGLYGLMAYTVGQRLREIGIRMALGACRRQILRLVLLDGARIAGAGLVLGLAGALAITPLLSGLMFGIGARDPFVFFGLAAFLAAVALVACIVPATRAGRVDPMRVLRSE